MRSLIRSMGAAAVLETAAETPPTVQSVSKGFQAICVVLVDGN